MPKRGRQVSIRVHRAVGRLVTEGYTATQIYKDLFPNGVVDPDHVSSKTIQRMVAERRVSDPSARWTFLGADPEDAERILDVACEVFLVSEGREWLTQDLAACVLRVRTAAPNSPSRWAWFLAHAYRLLDQDAGADSRALDLTLAIKPWLDEDQAHHWADTLQRGDVLNETDERVIEILEALAALERWPPLMTPAWYEPNPGAVEPWQGPAPATAPPATGAHMEEPADA
jgi:hypothetical protein